MGTLAVNMLTPSVLKNSSDRVKPVVFFNTLMRNVPKWLDTLYSVSDHFGTLCIKGLRFVFGTGKTKVNIYLVDHLDITYNVEIPEWGIIFVLEQG